MIGLTISHYRVLEPIGHGGMGEVYLAEDVRLGRRVALKFLSERFTGDAAATDRFQREARAASALSHPNICPIHDVGWHEGRPFLVMDLLKGRTLKDRIAGGPIPLDELLDIGAQTAEGLQAAHQQGVVHRDIKPANIFVTDSGRVAILDFGLAKLREPTPSSATAAPTAAVRPDSLTKPGTAPGTMAYMSPEQALGKGVDARSDLFSLGILLYEMAAGQPPFQGATQAAVFDSLLNRAPSSVIRGRPDLPAELDHIILKALEKDPTVRHQSAADLKADLIRLRRAFDPAARSSIASAPAGPVVASGKAWLQGAAFAAVMILLVGAMGLWLWSRRAPEAAPPGERAAVTVAVLPLQDLSSDPALSHLRIAVSDEMTSALSYAPGLSVRPFSASVKFAGREGNLEEAARDLRAATLVTGQYFKDGDQLHLTLEAVQTADNKLVWRDSLTMPAKDLINLRDQVSERIRGGLIPALGVSRPVGHGTRPSDATAYEQYLRSLAVPRDPHPNKRAIGMLEEVVERDPHFAPAWIALSERYYEDSQYGDGGEAAMQRAERAILKARELDADLPGIARAVINLMTESGRLVESYAMARDFLRRRPDTSESHFSMSYVLRYAGLTEGAARECEEAYTIDPQDRNLRSCGFTMMRERRYDRARAFAAVDAGTEWSASLQGSILLREEKYLEGVEMWAHTLSGRFDLRARLATACQKRDKEEIERHAGQYEKILLGQVDPEPKTETAALLAWCGQDDRALRMLSLALEGGYCGVLKAADDAMWSRLWKDPRFLEILERASRCRQQFLDRTTAAADGYSQAGSAPITVRPTATGRHAPGA